MLHPLSQLIVAGDHGFPDMDHGVLALLHGDVEHRPFRIVEEGLQGFFPCRRLPGDGGAGFHKLAQHAALGYDVDIVGNIGCAGHEQGQLRNIGSAPQGFQGAGLLQGGQQGHGIHRAAPYIDGRHGGEDILMLGQVKILGGQHLHRLLHGGSGDQHAAQDGLFRLHGMGRYKGPGLFHGPALNLGAGLPP